MTPSNQEKVRKCVKELDEIYDTLCEINKEENNHTFRGAIIEILAGVTNMEVMLSKMESETNEG